MTMGVDVHSWAEGLRDLLQAERAAEDDAARSMLTGHLTSTGGGSCAIQPWRVWERAGLALRRLRAVRSDRDGDMRNCGEDDENRGGRRLRLELSRNEMPPHRFSSGDAALLVVDAAEENMNSKEKQGVHVSVVIQRIETDKIVVVVDDPSTLPSLDQTIIMVRVGAQVSWDRSKEAIDKIVSLEAHVQSLNDPSPELREVLFERQRQIDTEDRRSKISTKCLDKTSLNESQKRAAADAMIAPTLAVIHGPPGTGKTHTLEVLIRALVHEQGLKVLACAPSNLAVDNLVMRLGNTQVSQPVSIVRLGNPARILPQIHMHTLDAMLERAEQTHLARDVEMEIEQAHDAIQKTNMHSERREHRAKLKELRKELRQRRRKAIETVLDHSKVVLTTLVGAGARTLKDRMFDVVVVDEAAQALESECWIALLHGRKAILAGDHMQLSPILQSVSPSETQPLAAKTLFDRAREILLNGALHGDAAYCVMLKTQYRMHVDIMNFSSQMFYDNRLIADSSVAKHLLADLRQIAVTIDTLHPIVYCDTSSSNMQEDSLEIETTVGSTVRSIGVAAQSRGNTAEADVIAGHVARLLCAGVLPHEIGVITPYNRQVELCRQSIAKRIPLLEARNVEVATVDGFQGREKEAILLSLVRSNDEGEVGFLVDDRRMNVALTRARRHLFVVGDSMTISCHALLDSAVNYWFDGVAFIREAIEYEFETIDSHPIDCIDNREQYLTDWYKNRNDHTIVLKKTKQENRQTVSSNSQKKTKSKVKSQSKKGSKSNDGRFRDLAEHEKSEWEHATEMQILSMKPGDSKEFTTLLTAAQRHYIHSFVESIDGGSWHHVSQTTSDGQRQLIVIKPLGKLIKVEKSPKPRNVRENVSKSLVQNGFESLATNESSDDELKCENLQLPELQSVIQCINEDEKSVTMDMASEKREIQTTMEKADNDAIVRPKLNEINGDDEVERAMASLGLPANGKCGGKACLRSVVTNGHICTHCRLKYCWSHAPAESHGCGEAARVSARQSWLNMNRSGKTLSSSSSQSASKPKYLLSKKIQGQKADRLSKAALEAAADSVLKSRRKSKKNVRR